MNKKSFLTIAVLACISAPTWAAITPRIDIGTTNFSQSIAQTVEGTEGQTETSSDTLEGDLLTFGLGLTLSGDVLFLDVEYKGAVEKVEDTLGLNESFDDGFSYNYDINYAFDRNDMAITLGAAFESGITIFGGFKTASSNFVNKGFNYSLYDENMFPIFEVSSAEEPYDQEQSETTYDSSGIFGGASYYMSLGDIAGLTISAAYTQMGAERSIYRKYYDWDAELYEEFNETESLEDATGLSLSATLAFEYLYFKAETQSYEFQELIDNGDGTSETIAVEEAVVRMSAGIRF